MAIRKEQAPETCPRCGEVVKMLRGEMPIGNKRYRFSFYGCSRPFMHGSYAYAPPSHNVTKENDPSVIYNNEQARGVRRELQEKCDAT